MLHSFAECLLGVSEASSKAVTFVHKFVQDASLQYACKQEHDSQMPALLSMPSDSGCDGSVNIVTAG